MSEVSSTVLKYAVRGANKAQRKDRQVRDSLKRTGREARKQSGTIKNWMKRHKTAIAGIGTATAAAMGAIIKNSPTMRGELASARIGFSLFAMTIGEDVSPALSGLGEAVLDAQEWYAGLDESVRKPISGLIAFTLAVTTVAGVVAGLQTLFSGTVIATALSFLAAKATAAGGALAGIASVSAAVTAGVALLVTGVGLLASELLGITDTTDMVDESSNRFLNTLASLAFFLLGPLIGALGIVWAAWEGGWDNAMRVGHRFFEEMKKAFGRLAVELGAGIRAFGALVHTGFKVMWDVAVAATRAGADGILSATETGINGVMTTVFTLREYVPALFAAMWDMAKNETAEALNWISSRAVEQINNLIDKANEVPGVDIDNVSAGTMSVETEDPSRHFRRAQERAERRFGRNRVSLGGVESESVDSIRGRASSRLEDRLGRIRSSREGLRERFAASSIDFSEGGGAGGDETNVEDNSVTVEELRVEQQGTGDSEDDGRRAGQAAAEELEEQRRRRGGGR